MRDANSTKGDESAEPAAPAPVEGDSGSIHVIVGARTTRIVLSGEIDAELAAELNEATIEAEDAGLPIEVDAHHVTFMDSSGVAFLARLSVRSQHRVTLLRVPPTVRFLLEVTRIGEMLDVVDEDRRFQPVGPDTPLDD
ncbi:STAS domain-containing protein [Cellulomonas composti]|uniref:STAS domain-containing protein n=1 Tax=Cellulomonas composti TaxID=266130 RepID=A0A511J7A6_9CELL|nr:STAS domain-containing protein [Cellulomonas composti]GEL93871.1 hypothetical protein CCO02nite_05290 [Cellulomonas composti]